jgi:hypothetical protein
MPTRLIREGILTSERINMLSERAELFYRRLMSVVDDYGRFSANLTLLRASCYPLKLDVVKEDSIKKHLAEAEGAGLIVLYAIAGKAYLEIQDFDQRVQSKSKYPEIPSDQQKSTVVHGESQNKTALVGGEVEGEDVTSVKPVASDEATIVFEFWRTTMNHPKAAFDEKRKKLIKARLKEYSIEDLKAAIRGCSFCPHNMGKNENQTRYDGLDLILRDAAHIDRFMAIKPTSTDGKPVRLDSAPDDWWKTNSGITAKGKEQGQLEKDFDGWLRFKRAVIDKAGDGPWRQQ